ncbi:MAG: Gfo/Idh/MocA family oxidoreductase [Acidimicrobiia bacterium]|nr:Gfo/Idh/MocA family oxidoreductase [Acidimicrobiia bacterium]
MRDVINWGILGAGNIAGALVEGIREAGGRVAAVGSRDAERAAVFAGRFDIPASYGSYEDLLGDDGVDAVYVATTNELHHRNTLDAISAGKAVLCEKPFALNAHQGEEMRAAAQSAGVFVMEAMWMRFIPATVALLQMVERGDLGEIRAVAADFSFQANAGPEHRLVDPALGGGALLDLGLYPISLAMLLLGEPTAISAQASIGPSGVDEQVAASMVFPGGQVGSIYASFLADSPVEAHVVGTEGRAWVRSRFHNSERLDVVAPDGSVTVHEYPLAGNGYRFEVAEVHRALLAGETESSLRPLADTLSVMEVLDGIRAQIGVRYPGE